MGCFILNIVWSDLVMFSEMFTGQCKLDVASLSMPWCMFELGMVTAILVLTGVAIWYLLKDDSEKKEE